MAQSVLNNELRNYDMCFKCNKTNHMILKWYYDQKKFGFSFGFQNYVN